MATRLQFTTATPRGRHLARPGEVEGLLRELAPQALGALMRRYDDFQAAEDAVQEALVAAAAQWAESGVPENPRGWLIQVASRRMVDQLRSEGARRRREELAATLEPEGVEAVDADDTLLLLFLCCHPALSSTSAIALTLRAVGGLTTREVAAAFLVPEATMAQRISRAKRSIDDAGGRFEPPAGDHWRERLDAVLQVLYLIFNEGYAASGGPELQRSELAGEAIRLARLLWRLLPEDGEVGGLLALMILTDARSPARTGPDGELIPLAEQDRSRWDEAAIAEGVALVTDLLATKPVGPYHLQAAIAAIHDEAPTAEETDWPQILALYGALDSITDNPMVELNHAVALAMVDGPQTGLERLDALEADGRLEGHHRLDAVYAHVLEMAGEEEAAIERYRRAAALTENVPEQRYLAMRAERLATGS
jgi:RNA polymerase sigma factor (sigma-70 family)